VWSPREPDVGPLVCVPAPLVSTTVKLDNGRGLNTGAGAGGAIVAEMSLMLWWVSPQ
jgi:hypothetical protein